MKNKHYVGDLYEDTHYGDYLLCILTLNGEEQLISTRLINYKNGVLSFYVNLPRIRPDENPLETEALVKIGHINEDLSGKLRKKDILIELPEGFEKLYILNNRES